MAQNLHLPFGDRQWTYNSRRAQELGKWAEQQGKGDAYHNAVFRAYFAEGHNLYDMDTLVNIASSVGLDDAVARQVLDANDFKAAVDRDWARAARSGIKAVPTFVANRQLLVGAQPYHVLKSFTLQQPTMDERATLDGPYKRNQSDI